MIHRGGWLEAPVYAPNPWPFLRHPAIADIRRVYFDADGLAGDRELITAA